MTLTSTPSSNGQIVANSGGGFDVQLSYTYADELSNQTFSVKVTDDGGQTTQASTSTFSVADALLAGPPSVTPASTSENVQTTSGLVITPAAGDTSAIGFQITSIVGGTLFQHDGATQIHEGDFINLTQGGAGLKFTPASNSLASGGFQVQEQATAR